MRFFCIATVLSFLASANSCDESKDDVWKDPDTGYQWSSKVRDKKWEEALDYCDDLSEGGYGDWSLPTISELRTLITGCDATETGGECEVTDSCTTSSCEDDSCLGCTDLPEGYSKLGDTEGFWSSSTNSEIEDGVWVVYIGFAKIDCIQQETFTNALRCIR